MYELQDSRVARSAHCSWSRLVVVGSLPPIPAATDVIGCSNMDSLESSFGVGAVLTPLRSFEAAVAESVSLGSAPGLSGTPFWQFLLRHANTHNFIAHNARPESTNQFKVLPQQYQPSSQAHQKTRCPVLSEAVDTADVFFLQAVGHSKAVLRRGAKI